MKNRSLLFISIITLVLFSCKREDVSQTGELVTITATQPRPPNLKTNIGGAGSTAVTWNGADNLVVFDATGGNVNVPFSYSSGAGTQSGTFTGTISGWTTGQEKTFNAVYPYDASKSGQSYGSYVFSIPSTQTQDFTSDAAKYAHLGANDFMAASPVTATNTGADQFAINFTFQHLMAILDIEVGNITGAALTVTQISIQRAADDFAKTAILDLTKIPGQNYQRGTVTNRLDLNVQDAGSTADGGVFTGSMIIAPADLSGGNTSFVVTVAGGAHYDVTKTVGPNLLAGKRYKVLITIGSPGFIDTRDDKVYKTVAIGTQTWMAENLAYLPSVVGPATGSPSLAYQYVNGYSGTDKDAAKATANFKTYGVLYNWPAAMNGSASSTSVPSGVQGICPDAWHLPSDAEWTTLINNLGGGAVAGGNLKETGTSHWPYPNAGTNSSGFTALPSGYSFPGGFNVPGYTAYFWSASGDGTSMAWDRSLSYDYNGVDVSTNYRNLGFSVRCLRND